MFPVILIFAIVFGALWLLILLFFRFQFGTHQPHLVSVVFRWYFAVFALGVPTALLMLWLVSTQRIVMDDLRRITASPDFYQSLGVILLGIGVIVSLSTFRMTRRNQYSQRLHDSLTLLSSNLDKSGNGVDARIAGIAQLTLVAKESQSDADACATILEGYLTQNSNLYPFPVAKLPSWEFDINIMALSESHAAFWDNWLDQRPPMRQDVRAALRAYFEIVSFWDTPLRFGHELEHVRMEDINLDSVKIENARIDKSILHNASGSFAKLNHLTLSESVIRSVRIDRFSVIGTTWSRCLVHGSKFRKTKFYFAKWSHLQALETSFEGCDFGGGSVLELMQRKLATVGGKYMLDEIIELPAYTVLQDSTFLRCDFSNSNLKGVKFRNCKFIDCDFTNAQCDGLILEDTFLWKVNIQKREVVKMKLLGESRVFTEEWSTDAGGRFLKVKKEETKQGHLIVARRGSWKGDKGRSGVRPSFTKWSRSGVP